MRLAVATAILAQGWPALATDTIIGEPITVHGTDRQSIERHGAFKTIQQPWFFSRKNRQDGSSKVLKERKVSPEHDQDHDTNSFSSETRAVPVDGYQECDLEASDADIGVLSCGIGLYCVGSEKSKTGGFCVSIPDEVDRNLQEGDDSMFDSLRNEFCETDYCGCEVDPDSYLLYVNCFQEECIEYISTCGTNITACRDISLELNVTSPGEYMRRRCIHYTEPYEQETCYEAKVVDNVVQTCDIEVEGVTCNSCDIVKQRARDDSCYQFDCTNTISEKSAFWSYFCEDGVNVAPIKDYLSTYDCDIYQCPICGGEDFTSTNPAGLIDLGDGTTTCAAVHQVALLGGFNETFCQEVVIPGVAEDCGCVPVGVESAAPAAVPTAAPSGASVVFNTRMAFTAIGLSIIALMRHV